MRLAAVVAALLTASLAHAAAKPAVKRVAKPDADAPWKVDDPHGPTHTIAFTTDEATWLPLDVNPAGTTIVFSLLGDLYTMPMTGGDAKRITSGPSFDAQPRFSPDGSSIAFASDRGGIENLWVCDLDGKNARAISTEKDTTVNGPAWSPDGAYLVGRKRLTDASSLGTVELWMWHVKGGSGVQLTKKDEQPDASDPVFSKDGRFLYFSARDARYRYDRNVNEGIWQIKRLDRWNGQTVPITGEFGGGAAPLISPDGRSMAFVRRIRAKTVLDLYDLKTGMVREVASDLQRDNQEGFSFHGVFPGYAFTPDGSSIVATAGGKIWKYDLSSGARTAIPFSAKVDQTLSVSLHTPRRAGLAKVRARIVRWPVETPDGKTLVFSALGHLYAMSLESGAPRRLTMTTDLEYAPSLSRDGRTLTFVTWNDAEGGHVWSMPFPSGTPKKLTDAPGQYANPAFSPDGRKIVFVAGSGATFRDDDLADELWQEIRWIPAEGGPANYVIGTKNRGPNRRIARPQFDASGERIYFVEDADGGGGPDSAEVRAGVRQAGRNGQADAPALHAGRGSGGLSGRPLGRLQRAVQRLGDGAPAARRADGRHRPRQRRAAVRPAHRRGGRVGELGRRRKDDHLDLGTGLPPDRAGSSLAETCRRRAEERREGQRQREGQGERQEEAPREPDDRDRADGAARQADGFGGLHGRAHRDDEGGRSLGARDDRRDGRPARLGRLRIERRDPAGR